MDNTRLPALAVEAQPVHGRLSQRQFRPLLQAGHAHLVRLRPLPLALGMHPLETPLVAGDAIRVTKPTGNAGAGADAVDGPGGLQQPHSRQW